MVRSIPCRTSGSQKCMGANPNFIARAIVIMFVCNGRSSVICHWFVNHAFVVAEKRMSAEAIAWVRKYFIVASVDRG